MTASLLRTLRTFPDRGPCLLLVSGLGSNADLWGDVIDLVTADRDVGVVETAILAGGRRPMKIAEFARRIAGEAAFLADGICPVGHSVGSFAAMAIAAELATPEAVLINGGLAEIARTLSCPLSALAHPLKSLSLATLVGATMVPRSGSESGLSQGASRLVGRHFAGDEVVSDPRRLAMLRGGGSQHSTLAGLLVNRAHWRDFVTTSRGFMGHVTLLDGSNDPLSSKASHEQTAGLFACGDDLIVDGARHCLPLERPQLVADSVKAALWRTAGPAWRDGES